jgi:flagellar protein FliS
MGTAANAYAAAYRTSEVEGLTQRDILVKMYLVAEASLAKAQAAMTAKRPADAHFACVRAKEIFIELASTLNFEVGGDLAVRLRDLYLFLIANVSEANLRKDPAKIAAIQPIVATLRAGWEQIPDEEANTTSLPEGQHRHAFDLRT